jgi:hypothetical protein
MEKRATGKKLELKPEGRARSERASDRAAKPKAKFTLVDPRRGRRRSQLAQTRVSKRASPNVENDREQDSVRSPKPESREGVPGVRR